MSRQRTAARAPPAARPSTAERLAAIVEAAEQAASKVIDDAEEQARQRCDEAEAEADGLVAERLAALADLVDSLIAQAEGIRRRVRAPARLPRGGQGA